LLHDDVAEEDRVAVLVVHLEGVGFDLHRILAVARKTFERARKIPVVLLGLRERARRKRWHSGHRRQRYDHRESGFGRHLAAPALA
jgi:hypothetical protein